jgi:hypothetical protein
MPAAVNYATVNAFATHLITYQQVLGNPINSRVPQHHENLELSQTQTSTANN